MSARPLRKRIPRRRKRASQNWRQASQLPRDSHASHQEYAMKTCILKPSAVAALAVVMGSTMAIAQSTGTTRSGDDRKFIEKAAVGGVTEVEMGKLGQQKASSGQVKQFAARMAQDHSKANDQLKQLAQAKGVAVPAAPDKSHQSEMDKLAKLSGAQFDKQYMSHMVEDHEKTVAEFKKASESAKDSEVKAFAAKTLPTLQDHLTQAQSLNESVKSASK
jgi:putative membrane protein